MAPAKNPTPNSQTPMESSSKSKHNKTDSSDKHKETQLLLLPGLPNHLAQRCLSSLPPPLLFSICRSWRRLLYSPSVPPFFSLYALLFPSHSSTNCIEFFSLDPFSSTWRPLPTPPQDPPLRLLHRHPSFLSRKLAVQSLTVSNKLVLIAATTDQFVPALSSPLVFQPESSTWLSGPQMPNARRWCAAGSVGGAIYVASGVGARYQREIARSMEQWDMKSENWRWEKKAQLKDSRFSRDAVEAVGYRGKLCMVNVKGNGAKEGAIYDVATDEWREMPKGMIAGWNGPAASMEEEEMYVVDEVRGNLSKYDSERDRWEMVIELAELRCTEQIAAARGRICAVCRKGERIVVVNLAVNPAKVWRVEPPRGFQAVALHVLPRMISQ